jgi:hypothetical protein
MAKTARKKATPKSGGAAKKGKGPAKAAVKKAVAKPRFVKKVGDLNMED